MKNAFCIIGVCVSLAGAGCAHSHKVDGPQEMSQIPAGIRVGIGETEVKEGDTLVVTKSDCHQVKTMDGIRKIRECHDHPIGSAIVLKVLDHDSAIVAPQNGLVMDSSMKVEKQKGDQK